MSSRNRSEDCSHQYRRCPLKIHHLILLLFYRIAGKPISGREMLLRFSSLRERVLSEVDLSSEDAGKIPLMAWPRTIRCIRGWREYLYRKRFLLRVGVNSGDRRLSQAQLTPKGERIADMILNLCENREEYREMR